MKKFLSFMVLSALAFQSGAQSLEDNEFYRKMVELRQQSQTAFDEGDYLEARRLAEEAQSYQEQSEEWIRQMLAAYRARAGLRRLQNRLAEVTRLNAEINFPDEFAEGTALYDQAYSRFHDEAAYVTSLESSTRGMEVLSVITGVAGLPASYVVRLLPGNTDCLWNISGYDFVYGDPTQWRVIYDANKDILSNPDNPDLIHPGMVLEIPSRNGEARSGTWTAP